MITLTNDFHGTQVTLRLQGAFLSAGQEKKAWKSLCGIKGCTCSGPIGIRGAQTAKIVSQEYSSTAGGLVPRFANDQ